MNIRTSLILCAIGLLVTACGGGGTARLSVPDDIRADTHKFGHSLDRGIPIIRAVGEEGPVAIEVKPLIPVGGLNVGDELRFSIGIKHNLPHPITFPESHIGMGFTNTDGSRNNGAFLGYDEWASYVQAKEGGSNVLTGLAAFKTAMGGLNALEGGSMEDTQAMFDDSNADFAQVQAGEEHARAIVAELGQEYWSPTTIYPGQKDYVWGFVSAGTYGGEVSEINLFWDVPGGVPYITFDFNNL